MAEVSSTFDASRLARKVASDIREGALLGALAYNAAHGKVEDDISECKAFKKYGKAWITHYTQHGMLHFTRVGTTEKSTKLYSVFEIETLKRAEKHITHEFNAAMRMADASSDARLSATSMD